MSPPNGITCAVCTYNCPATLRDALESLFAQEIGEGEMEILVIDNGGFPETAAVTEHFLNHGPFRFRSIREGRVGLSNARNRAMAEARFPIIAFIDDDAEASPAWAAKLLEAFGNTDAWAAGGPVEPKWECTRPDWLTDNLLRNLSIIEWGGENRWLEWPERIIGTNMAFRISELQELGGFDPALGRVGGNMLGMEDTVIQQMMAERGRRVFYEAGASVKHLIPQDRCRKSYFFKRSYGHTISQLKTGELMPGNLVARWLKPIKRLVGISFRYVKSLAFNRRQLIRPVMAAGRELALLHWNFSSASDRPGGKSAR